jgi:phosphoesterase RecJ-like protein
MAEGNHLPDKFMKKLGQHSRVLVTPHESPDADAIGSALGLAWHIKGLGKECRIVISPKLPDYLGFLDVGGWIEAFCPKRHADIALWPDCWAVLDANELNRLGPLKTSFLESRAARACIDHHLNGDMELFDFFISKPEASSTCELLMDALGLDSSICAEMASALYAGLVDDTGNFKFSCTTPHVHRIAAVLLEKGARADEINRGLYCQASTEKMRIFGSAYNQVKMYADGRLAVMSVSLADLKSTGATHDDLEGLVSRPLELKTVEVAILAYEKSDGTTKLSMRSKSKIDINAICRQFGGGGHRLASGASFKEPLDDVLAKVVLAAIDGIVASC